MYSSHARYSGDPHLSPAMHRSNSFMAVAVVVWETTDSATTSDSPFPPLPLSPFPPLPFCKLGATWTAAAAARDTDMAATWLFPPFIGNSGSSCSRLAGIHSRERIRFGQHIIEYRRCRPSMFHRAGHVK